MNKQLDTVKNNDEVKSFIEKHKLTDEQIENQLSSFIRFMNSKSLCEGCKGLYQCRQKSKGEVLSLSYQGVVIEEIEYCKYMLKKNNESKHLNNFVYCDIPDKFRTIDLDNIEYTEDQKELYAYMLAILHEKINKGLYISGDYGVGKTYLCTALANSLAKKGKKVAFVKVSTFISDMKGYVSNAPELLEKYIRILKNADYLILDDLGSEAVSEFVRDDIIYNIIEYRNDNNLITIFTSNLNIKDLSNHYRFERNQKTNSPKANRLVERIEDMCETYTLTGKNMRRLNHD